MGGGAKYFGLTVRQISRIAACAREEENCETKNFTRNQVSIALEVEEPQAGRFIRDMESRGLIICVYRPTKRGLGNRSKYRTSKKWKKISKILEKSGLLPGLCQVKGCKRAALPFRYRERYFCYDHMMSLGCGWCKWEKKKDCSTCRSRPSEVKDV